MFERSVILREFPLRWMLLWLLLPHIVIVAMLPLGGPPMTWALVFTVPAVILCAQLPWLRVKAAFAAMLMAGVTIVYVTVMFNLNPGDVSQLPRLLRDVRPLQSPEYFVGALIVVVALYVLLRHTPRVDRFRTPMAWCLAFLIGFGLVVTENRASEATRGSYRRAPMAGDTFSSASAQSGIAIPNQRGRHVIIIVVEALGLPRGGEEEALFRADWLRAGWNARYDVSSGTVPYYGSTTNAEFRELCNVWADYTDFDFSKADCLPGRYKAAGYHTRAIHSFTGGFFDRKGWYPRLQFDEALFAEQLTAVGAARCGGMFNGVCDTGVPPLIAERLRKAKQPELTYWLTLNSHLPVLPDEALGTASCQFGGRIWSNKNPQLCRLFLVHHRLAEAIDKMAMDPDLPPTDILIVGDHVPPFFDRASRLRFNGKEVPWIMLRAK